MTRKTISIGRYCHVSNKREALFSYVKKYKTFDEKNKVFREHMEILRSIYDIEALRIIFDNEFVTDDFMHYTNAQRGELLIKFKDAVSLHDENGVDILKGDDEDINLFKGGLRQGRLDIDDYVAVFAGARYAYISIDNISKLSHLTTTVIHRIESLSYKGLAQKVLYCQLVSEILFKGNSLKDSYDKILGKIENADEEPMYPEIEGVPTEWVKWTHESITDKQSFKETIKSYILLRKKLKISQTELSKLCSIQQSAISIMEKKFEGTTKNFAKYCYNIALKQHVSQTKEAV